MPSWISEARIVIKAIEILGKVIKAIKKKKAPKEGTDQVKK